MSEKITTKDEKDTSRVDAFSDGVFAIVITLLVFNLRIPPLTDADNLGLVTALAQQWPSYLSFITSFFVIGIMWVNHHRIFRQIGKVDNRLLYLNLLLLLGVSFIPFPTGLVAQYVGHRDQHVAALVYAATSLVIALLFNFLWQYINRHRYLCLSGTPDIFFEKVSRAYRLGPIGYIMALVLSLINVPLCLLVLLGMAIFFAASGLNE
jgi:uncharacterized membrane protein